MFLLVLEVLVIVLIVCEIGVPAVLGKPYFPIIKSRFSKQKQKTETLEKEEEKDEQI